MAGKGNKVQTEGVSVKLCFRPSALDGHEGRLYYRIIIHRVCYQHNSAYTIFPTEWSDSVGFVIANDDTNRRKELLTIKSRTLWEMHQIVSIARALSVECSEADINTILIEFENAKASQSFTAFCKEQAGRLIATNRLRTSETYLSAYKSFMRFRGGEDIMLYQFNTKVIEEYETFLQESGVSMNTISFYMRNLRTLFNKAVKQSLIPSCNFFADVYTGIAQTAKRAISMEELRRIKDLDLKLYPNLAYARDMFMLSFYFRGMSFIDMANLQHCNLQNGHVIYHRSKTKQRLDVKWEPEMTEILDKYPLDAKYLLPILHAGDKESRSQFKYISKQVNRWLKKIGKMADVKLPLTMYVARHTWASLAKQKNVPVGVISDALGHDSEKTTLIYLSTLDTSAVDNANGQILADL
ncbi:site-specific integrase [Hallella bergensis]|uniref:tyrosine-type recombinase/integrase n=1 Tax=Hallella bergensis TaxID=242750 RepID=UPI0023EFE1B3|nr:site-specific integrase [Hallella bergensis]